MCLCSVTAHSAGATAAIDDMPIKTKNTKTHTDKIIFFSVVISSVTSCGLRGLRGVLFCSNGKKTNLESDQWLYKLTKKHQYGNIY